MFGAPQQSASQNPQLKAAKLEMQAVTDMYNKMTTLCHERCFATSSDTDAEINVGELTCTDRCVGKYLEAQQKVGEIMKRIQEQQQAMQQAQQNFNP
eukprot:snap_masked-scaffold_61-processed-gene-0.35-mRNA-1 protein AED:0.03 eAED:0.03 QI:0/-1/0/1/-1/1/1/0/96